MRLALGVCEEPGNWSQWLAGYKEQGPSPPPASGGSPLECSTLRTHWELVGKGEVVACLVPALASQSGVWKGDYRAKRHQRYPAQEGAFSIRVYQP